MIYLVFPRCVRFIQSFQNGNFISCIVVDMHLGDLASSELQPNLPKSLEGFSFLADGHGPKSLEILISHLQDKNCPGRVLIRLPLWITLDIEKYVEIRWWWKEGISPYFSQDINYDPLPPNRERRVFALDLYP